MAVALGLRADRQQPGNPPASDQACRRVAADKGVARVRRCVDSVAHDPASDCVRTAARRAGRHEPVGPGRSSGGACHRARPHAVLNRRRFRKVPWSEMAQPARRRLATRKSQGRDPLRFLFRLVTVQHAQVLSMSQANGDVIRMFDAQLAGYAADFVVLDDGDGLVGSGNGKQAMKQR